MNCATHPEVAAASYCRTCGKALCEECKRDVRGVVYCEECIAARLQGTAPGAALPQGGNPVLAALLGLIPGVGAMYNGQFTKGIVHVVIFAVLVGLADSGQYEEIFGLLIMFFFFYQVFDAYRTAKARQLGQPIPEDPLGLSRGLWGPGEAAGSFSQVPTGALVLIGLGVLFLLSNAGVFHWNWIGRLWPLVLIALGIRMYMHRQSGTGR
ncbi:MAG: B-box zinc finger protein [Terriglobales bacterium]